MKLNHLELKIYIRYYISVSCQIDIKIRVLYSVGLILALPFLDASLALRVFRAILGLVLGDIGVSFATVRASFTPDSTQYVVAGIISDLRMLPQNVLSGDIVTTKFLLADGTNGLRGLLLLCQIIGLREYSLQFRAFALSVPRHQEDVQADDLNRQSLQCDETRQIHD